MTTATAVHPPGPLERSRELDERAARATLRRQIARLERRLADTTMELWNTRVLEPVARAPVVHAEARLLTLAELETARDGLVAAVRAAEDTVVEHAGLQADARSRLEAMLADPAAHRYETIRRADLGEPSCGAYHVVPRLGLLGMLFGWWCVKLSSGCP